MSLQLEGCGSFDDPATELKLYECTEIFADGSWNSHASINGRLIYFSPMLFVIQSKYFEAPIVSLFC